MNNIIDNFDQFVHKGRLPVRVLEQNIIDFLEKESPDFNRIVNISNEKGLKKGVKYLVYEKSILPKRKNEIYQMPHIDGNKTIHLHETFLSFVWIIGYCLYTMYREYDPKINDTEEKLNSSTYINSSLNLLEYGLSLINNYTPWDYKLPNPEKFPPSDLKLKECIEHTNGIFLYGVLFILFHEISHVDLKHIDYGEEFYKKYRKQIPGNQIKIMEYEADNAAFGYFIKMLGSDGKKDSIKLGCVIGMCCLLILSEKLESSTHPSSHERIKSSLVKLDLDENDAVWNIANMALILWCNIYKKDCKIESKYNSSKELFELLYQELDKNI